MQESIDDLYARWQKNPDVSQTVALCDALRGSPRGDLVDIVGGHASRQLDVNALTAAARMYTGSGRLDDAQQVLIAAGRLAPRDGDVYRYLGEVLLRRGDAERAEKVLERAIQFGARDPAAAAWLDRARALLSTQQRSGMPAVAGEVARGPAPQPGSAGVEPDEAETQVRKNDDVKAALAANARSPAPGPAAGRAPPPAARGLGGPPPRSVPPLPQPPQPQASQASQASRAASPFGIPTTHGIGVELPRSADPPASAPFGSHGLPGSPGLQGPQGPQQTASIALPPPSRGIANAGAASADSAPFSAQSAPSAAAAAAAAGYPGHPGLAPPPPLPVPPQDLPVNPFLVPPKPPRPVGPNGQAMPEARDVLEALQIAGVFEAEGAGKPQVFAWDKPAKGRRRIGSFLTLITLACAIVGGATGAYRYVTGKRAKEHLESEAMLAKVDADLAASDQRLLDASEQTLARSFDLESRSPHAALTWLHERAMVGLLKSSESVAFEDGAVRAREVRVEEKRIAFASAASFLFQNDTAGAAATIAKWDGKADDDAWYQLVAGATFERAGDTRSLERYAAAVKLDPGLVIAQVLLARATAVDGDPRRAGELAKEFRAKYPDRVEGATLVALAWARDALRGEPPPEAKEIIDKADVLPAPLKAVAPAVRALLAVEQHKNDEARTALQKGLAVADTPGIAAWLGSIALATGDEALARKAALAAVSFSAVYPPARILAARVALLGVRLDEALKASEELPPTSPDVAIVTAAVAYEKLDAERMRAAIEATPEEARKLPVLIPLIRGLALMGGSASALAGDKAFDIADVETPWADLVAMDAALDTGDLDLAHKIAATWAAESRPPNALRAARASRLARWDGKNEDADRLSRVALEGGTVTVRALTERVFVLVAAGKTADAIALFKAYPNVGGPLAKWLRAYAVASGGKLEEARAILSQEDPPPPLAPLPARAIAAAAYGAVKDTRHGNEYVKALVTAGFANPDIQAAAEKVGVGKIGRRR